MGQPIGSSIPESVEVLIVCSERVELLGASVRSLLKAAAEAELSIKICVLMNSPRNLSEAHPSINSLRANPLVEVRWHHGDRLRPGDARNFLIRSLQSPWAFFIDDDAFPSTDIFLKFANLLALRPDAVLVGGPNLTPKDSNPTQMITGAALESLWGTLQSRSRYFPTGVLRPAKEAFLSSCNLFVRRDFLIANPYPKHYRTAEEAYFLSKAIAHHAGQCFYDPQLIVYHHRRGDWPAFSKQVFGYARGRGQMIAEGLIESYWHFVPSLALLFFLLLLPFSFARPYLLAAFLLYSTATFWFSSELCRRLQRPDRLFAATTAYLVLHLSYALGFLTGLSQKFSLAKK